MMKLLSDKPVPWPYLSITVKVVLFISILSPSVKGSPFQPIAYTFPDGLQSVNGSSSTGGCGEMCTMIPIPGTSTNACDCPGTGAASGVLVDGNIPTIDTTQRGTWANGLFVVNKNGQNSTMIAFQFEDPINLRNVQVTYLNCQIWGTGASRVDISYSYIFPGFGASFKIGTLVLGNDTFNSCTSLRTISIPAQPEVAINNYIITFSLVGTSARPLNWLHLGEIKFSDMVPTSHAPTTHHPTTTSAAVSTMPVLATTFTEADLGDPETTPGPVKEILSTSSSINDTANTLDITLPIFAEITSSNTSTTIFIDFGKEYFTMAPPISIPISIPLGISIGIIGLLILLISVLTVIIILLCIYIKKRKPAVNSSDHYDYITESDRASNEMQMKVNEAYGTCGQDGKQIICAVCKRQTAETNYENV